MELNKTQCELLLRALSGDLLLPSQRTDLDDMFVQLVQPTICQLVQENTNPSLLPKDWCVNPSDFDPKDGTIGLDCVDVDGTVWHSAVRIVVMRNGDFYAPGFVAATSIAYALNNMAKMSQKK
jgi:hypothetical protein